MDQPSWREQFDEFDNSVFVLIGTATNGFSFRLKQRLFNNSIEWCEDHDPELRGDGWPAYWADLAEAKAEIEKRYKNHD